MSGYKKNSMNYKQGSLVVCYWLLCIDLGDGISCILSFNHNIQRGKWCLSAMDKMSFEVRKCVGNAFSKDLETQMLTFPPSVPIMGASQQTVKNTDLADSKETQSLRKTDADKSASVFEKSRCRQKWLNKSLNTHQGLTDLFELSSLKFILLEL